MRTHFAAGGLVVVVLALFAAAPPAAAQGLFSNAGDIEAGLAFDGDSFNEAYLRYYMTPRIGIQAGFGYERSSVDVALGPDTTISGSSLDFRIGALYEICGGDRHRGYLLPSVSFSMIDMEPNEATAVGFGLALGGDVKLNDYFMIGLEGGLRFVSTSVDFDGTEVADGTSWSVGNTNRLNLTLRFPRGG